MENYRKESDLLGELSVPVNAYYGVQTQRAIENFKISGQLLSSYPEFIRGLAFVKKAAAKTNYELGLLDEQLYHKIAEVCDELLEGQLNDQFPIDMIQGGAGTSVNMNANEVIANRVLEKMGKDRGDYQFCSPNDHINLSQSTNDAYPTAIKLALIQMNRKLVEKVKTTVAAFRAKGAEYQDVLKMGRTQLQDAVPMTLGQEFEAFAANLLVKFPGRFAPRGDAFPVLGQCIRGEPRGAGGRPPVGDGPLNPSGICRRRQANVRSAGSRRSASLHTYKPDDQAVCPFRDRTRSSGHRCPVAKRSPSPHPHPQPRGRRMRFICVDERMPESFL